MNRNYPQIFAICRAQGLVKEELVQAVSNGRTSSLRELTDAEYRDLMDRLQAMQSNRKNWTPPPGDRQRKKLLRIARQMGWGADSDNPMKKALAMLDGWSMKQKYKKPLMQHSPAELNVLVTIFEEMVYTSYLRDLNR